MRLIPFNQQILRGAIQVGDCVVDATVGGGYDTLFLAQCVGHTGRVIGFDIQQDALDQTRKLLEEKAVAATVELHLLSHERMEEVLPEAVPLRAVVFNLGYLPGGDHQLITQPESTLAAVRVALERICVGGLVSIMSYPAHVGGSEEYEALHAFLREMAQKKYTVMHSLCFNASGRAPQLWSIQRQGE